MAPVLPSDFDGILPPPDLGVTVRQSKQSHDLALQIPLRLTYLFHLIATWRF
jgi:hypothetical protein